MRYFADAHNKKVVDDLLAQVKVEAPKKAAKGAKLEGKTFVLTGTLPTLEREAAKAMILAQGGKVSSSVSKNTSYVVAGENAGSKYSEAKKLNIPIIDEMELLKLVK